MVNDDPFSSNSAGLQGPLTAENIALHLNSHRDARVPCWSTFAGISSCIRAPPARENSIPTPARSTPERTAGGVSRRGIGRIKIQTRCSARLCDIERAVADLQNLRGIEKLQSMYSTFPLTSTITRCTLGSRYQTAHTTISCRLCCTFCTRLYTRGRLGSHLIS